jgi:tryptophan synthase alpha chain
MMGYFNPIHAYGVAEFTSAAGNAGVDGLIIVDLPPEEEAELYGPAQDARMDIIRLVAPTTHDARIGTLIKKASGFVYYVSVRGITGTSSAAVSEIESNVARIRKQTDLPVAVGFGIRTPEQAAKVAKVADAAVVGTAIVEQVADALDESGNPIGDVVGNTLEYVRKLAAAVRGARSGNDE